MEARAKAPKKGEVDPASFDALRFGMADSGRFAQILHKGHYDDEPATFEQMEGLLTAKGLKRASKTHHEIYISNPQRTAPGKFKTILRVAVDRS